MIKGTTPYKFCQKRGCHTNMLSEEGVTFHAERIPKGTPIFPELSENATYDNDVVKLYGDRSIDTPLVYSSNHDGSIQLYSFPSSWTSTNVDATDKDAVEKYAEDVVKTTRTVTIPEGNPTSVKEMIELLN
ncbi:hypothetical protein [Vagococcus acidifermentans]|uniref:Uncharacterized protein n=1 Tax=Vagococcus acidifermentans TaxID=564710 RepID=A0A430AMI4_9ENTE|nr:hypothetical protein [Vagococcus acidifermentans]RSU09331.1 hypothetical protein CBF27_13035 [Vagococcus acidifermentans]